MVRELARPLTPRGPSYLQQVFTTVSYPLWHGSVSTNLQPFPRSLKDKKYASDKYKDIYTELSIVKAKADCDISRLKEQLKAATEALGEKSPENTTVSGYGQSSSNGSLFHSLYAFKTTQAWRA